MPPSSTALRVGTSVEVRIDEFIGTTRARVEIASARARQSSFFALRSTSDAPGSGCSPRLTAASKVHEVPSPDIWDSSEDRRA